MREVVYLTPVTEIDTIEKERNTYLGLTKCRAEVVIGKDEGRTFLSVVDSEYFQIEGFNGTLTAIIEEPGPDQGLIRPRIIKSKIADWEEFGCYNRYGVFSHLTGDILASDGITSITGRPSQR